MLNDVAGIKIQGSNFIDETELMFFSNNKNSYSTNILFGRNGSGKSTIAQGIRNIKYNSFENDISCCFIDESSNKVELDDKDLKNVHIFDEEFINENIKLAEVGLNTIILLGENVDVENKLGEANLRRDLINEALTKINTEIKICEDERNTKSHLYWKNKVISSLKKPGNWAEKDAYFKNNKVNSSVTINICDELYKLKPSKSEKELREEFNKKERLFNKYRNKSLVHVNEIDINVNYKFNDEELKELLETKIQKPILSDREKLLLSLGNRKINEIKEHFKENDICPYCLQDLESEYKEHLFETIQKILNEEANKYSQHLRNTKLNKLEIDLEDYKRVDLDQANLCIKNLNLLNNEIENINELIDKKLENIYEDIIIPEININKLYIRFINLIENLNNKCIAYNYSVNNISNLRDELIEINKYLGHYEIKADYDIYLGKILNYDSIIKRKNDLIIDLNDTNIFINELESKKYNYEGALNSINKGLSYIFFSDNKLKLEYFDEKYVLKCDGKSVKPSQISTGERNAIALCYFFSKLREGSDKDNFYKSNYLVIIDDPISSFDYENKIGILSYLKFEIRNYFFDDSMNKFLIMSHDLQTLFDIDKFIGEIYSKYENKKYRVSELINLKIEGMDLNKRKQYSNLINMIFDYANTAERMKVSHLEPFIGNVMRKVMEAYSTFNYRIGFEDLFCSDKILSRIDSDYREYYKTFMSRLILNNESHYKDAISSNETNIDFFKYVSDKEKRRTAKHIMCFLYMIDENHVLSYLNGRPNANDKINDWIKEIPKI